MKTVQEIYDSMRGRVAQLSGLAVSENGELSLRLSAIAHEIYSLYAEADWVRRQCFPQTALGEELDKHAVLRGLHRQAAEAAAGVLRFSVDSPADQALTVPSGTVCMTAGLERFVTTEDCVIAAGGLSAEAAAVAEQAGTAGNAAPGEILVMAAPPLGVTGCVNPGAFVGGRDVESDEALRERILADYAWLQNGANVGYYKSLALEVEGVAAAAVIPCKRGVNTVDVVITGEGGLPEAVLLAQVSELFDSRRELGTDVLVRSPETAAFSPVIYLIMEPDGDFAAAKAQVVSRLTAALTGKYLGQVISGQTIGDWLGTIDGVRSYTVTAPAHGLIPAADVLPRLGTVSVNSAGVAT